MKKVEWLEGILRAKRKYWINKGEEATKEEKVPDQDQKQRRNGV